MAKTGAVGDDRWVPDAFESARRRVDDEVLAVTMLWKWDLEREVDAVVARQLLAVLWFGTDGQRLVNRRIAPASGGLPIHSLTVLTAAELVVFDTKAKAKVFGGLRFVPTTEVARWPRDQVRAVVGAPSVSSVQHWKIARRPLSMVVHGSPDEHHMTIGTSPNDEAFLTELAPETV
ncbi:MAG: hypothetical protein JWN67_3154 [Actinomycetia bacterium]|nr:hypothetical protein [Actinomycetes bacterium]